jgi:DNA-binding NarL/FixJ family response regulator
MIIKIILADDHSIVRDGIRSLLEKEPGFMVVGEAENGRKAVQQTLELRPDIVIMDISMPDLNGIEATRQITAQCPGIKIIALSMHADKRFVTEMLQAGVSGYMQKNCAFKNLVSAIRTVMVGQIYLTPAITGIVVEGFKDRLPATEAPTETKTLSSKEREVLQLLAEGSSTKEIADRLKISVKTVDTHRQHIMDKLGLRSIAELTKYAIRAGLTSIEN